MNFIKDGFDRYTFSVERNKAMTSIEWMGLSDEVLKECIKENEEQIFIVIYNCMKDLKALKLKKINRIRIMYDWLIRNPIYKLDKNINKMIIDEAFPVEAHQKKAMLEYMTIANGLRRLASFLHRFWLPNQYSWGIEIKMSDGNKVRVPRTIDDLALNLWPEIINCVDLKG